MTPKIFFIRACAALRSDYAANLFLFFFFCCNLSISSNALAGAGMAGAKTITASNTIVNEFTTLTADVSTGATAITVASSTINANSRFSGSLVAGELLMIIQMRGATMNTASATSSSWGAITAYNNAGEYEFVQVASIPNGTTINLSSSLTNSYTASGEVQVIRVPRYSSLTVNSGASITSSSWNGSTGGTVAIEVSGTTTMNGTIDVSGLGFAGGALNDHSLCCPAGSNISTYASTNTGLGGAEKGEGIGGNQTIYDGLGGRYGRGAAANGGGGGSDYNSGGGGGANGNNGLAYNGFGYPDTSVSTWIPGWDLDGATPTFHKNTSSGGGRGGYSYGSQGLNPLTVAPGNSGWYQDDRSNVGGLGGRALDNTGNRIFMGGGGGAGDENNNVGSAGGNGGGIVYLLAGGTVSGSGTINANGADAAAATTAGSQGDGAGGGGGGGSVVVFTFSASMSGLTINAKGGKGGDQDWSANTGDNYSPGGGGGGGYISVPGTNSFTTNTAGGHNGITNNNSYMATFLPNGATMGASGTVSTPTNPYSGAISLPIELVSFSGVKENNSIELTWVTSSEINNNYFTLQRSADGMNYSFLAKVNGAGNSTTLRTYQYDDDSPLNADNYYLLSQTDYDGKSESFYPIHVINSAQSVSNYIVGAGPIPFHDNIKIDYYVTNGGAVEMSIINLLGQVVKDESTVSGDGMNSVALNNLSGLSEGIYFLRMTGDSKSMSLKLIKN